MKLAFGLWLLAVGLLSIALPGVLLTIERHHWVYLTFA